MDHDATAGEARSTVVPPASLQTPESSTLKLKTTQPRHCWSRNNALGSYPALWAAAGSSGQLPCITHDFSAYDLEAH